MNFCKSVYLLSSLAVCLCFVSCSNPNTILQVNDGSGFAKIRLTASAGSPFTEVADSAVVTVSSSGMKSIVMNLTIEDTVVFGTVEDIPAGENRLFRIDIFDSAGIVQYSGSTTADILPDSTVDVTIILKRVAGNANVSGIIVDTVEIADGGLIAYYPFNGNAEDESGNGNNGTIYGAILTEDRYGVSNSAFMFNGIDSYIRVKDADVLDVDSAITISAWIKTDFTAPDVIISKWGDIGDYANNRSYSLLVPSEDSIEFSFSTTADQNQTIFHRSLYPIPDNIENIWIHIVATYDGSTKVLYINGEKIGSFKRSGLIHKGIADLAIGAYLSASTNPSLFFKGSIDDIRIYNRALTLSEIQQLDEER